MNGRAVNAPNNIFAISGVSCSIASFVQGALRLRSGQDLRRKFRVYHACPSIAVKGYSNPTLRHNSCPIIN